MKWLTKEPELAAGVTFGTPWAQGRIQPGDVAGLLLPRREILHEARPLAFWPDGSVKWTGHVAVAHKGLSAADLHPALPDPAKGAFDHEAPLCRKKLATKTADGIHVENDALSFFVPGRGESLIEDIRSLDGSLLGSRMRLVVQAEGATVNVDNAEVETSGMVRSVVRISGTVEGTDCIGPLLEFVVRITVFAGVAALHLTQTVLFHDAAKDRAIKGLGTELDRPLTGDLFHRRVSVAGDSCVYSEPVQSLYSGSFSRENDSYRRQLSGLPVYETTETTELFALGRKNAVWAGFRITQESEDYFRVEKQTKAGLLRVRMGKGHRSPGLLYAGDISGGVAVSVKDFWQKYPAALEVAEMHGSSARLTAWTWAESVEPMDLRHYSDECYVASAYEGFEHLASTPEGVANTSHVNFDFMSATPSDSLLWELAKERQEPSQPVHEPEIYYSSGAAGNAWSLPEQSRPEGQAADLGVLLERRLTEVVEFYLQEVDQRGWYGYWNYGDVMHSYDKYRHEWRYDLGGFAWANNELAPTMWLWQYFLRTGDARVYRLAEAMTWHTAEVDRHHFGEYAQLGSRHNVVHWGCSCKEVRISMAGLHRQYYFISGGDERIGELLSEVRDAEKTIGREDAKRANPAEPGPVQLRIGPDWAALTSNWHTEWERTGDPQWRDRILRGIEQIASMPLGMLSGPTVIFDPDTVSLQLGDSAHTKQFHMVIAFGAPQVWTEIAESLDHDEFRRMLADFGRFYALTDADKQRLSAGGLTDRDFSWPYMATGMMAYGAWYYRDEELAAKVWEILLTNADLHVPLTALARDASTWRPVTEHIWISTNWASQWSLNVMLSLKLIGPPGTRRWASGIKVSNSQAKTTQQPFQSTTLPKEVETQ